MINKGQVMKLVIIESPFAGDVKRNIEIEYRKLYK